MATGGVEKCEGAFSALGTNVVITGIVSSNTLQDAIPADEVHLSAVMEALREHRLGIESIVEIEHVACVASQKGTR
jgi:hypothetical protein